jgi:hypothetical protein
MVARGGAKPKASETPGTEHPTHPALSPNGATHCFTSSERGNAMNAIIQLRDVLEERNYVRKADPARQNYWHDWSWGPMEKKREATGDDFFLILYGSPDKDDDFFVIPYPAVKHVLTDETLAEVSSGFDRRRWVGTIRNRKLKISHAPEVDVSPYYGNRGLLARAVGETENEEYVAAGEAYRPELGNELAFTPTEADERLVVLRQIKARRGQQAFREALRDRYGDRCMISGCELMDVVEAAHIKSYRGQPDNHPANGLLLRCDLHTLFDLDLIGVEPGTLLVHVHPDAAQAGYGQYSRIRLLCAETHPDDEVLTVRWELFRRRLLRVSPLRGSNGS